MVESEKFQLAYHVAVDASLFEYKFHFVRIINEGSAEWEIALSYSS